MGTTPEGKVKAKLRKLLKNYPDAYAYWPVPTGFGKTTLDVLGCYRGRFFEIETKAPGKKPTLRQQFELESIGRAMGKTFVITGTDSPVFDELRQWLDELTATVPHDPHIPRDQTNRRIV
jgi:hypothetical protein